MCASGLQSSLTSNKANTSFHRNGVPDAGDYILQGAIQRSPDGWFKMQMPITLGAMVVAIVLYSNISLIHSKQTPGSWLNGVPEMKDDVLYSATQQPTKALPTFEYVHAIVFNKV